MLRKLISIIFIFIAITILFYNYNEDINREIKIDNVISTNNINRKYDGYLVIEKLKYKGLIRSGEYDEILDSNLILMISDKNLFNSSVGNIILAGHNNKYVFSKLYKLNIGDEIIISDFNNEYAYTVENLEYINIKNKSVLDNIYDKKILTLITCTNDNQVRYVVRAKYNHIISENNN